MSQTPPVERSSGIHSPPTPPTFEAEFGKAFDERYPGLFRYLDRMTGDAAMASDIAQQTFVKLYERGQMPDNVRGWLVSVASNLFRDERRRVHRQRRLLAMKTPDATMADAPPPIVAQLIREEQRLAVRRALDVLPERDRMLLLLRHEGYSYRELAAAITVAESSVGTLLARASAAFRRAIKESRDASL